MTRLLLILLLLAPPLSAQTIEGRVLVEETGAVISGATVEVLGEGLSATTNERGAFTLRGVPEGEVTLGIRRLGYAFREVQVTVAGRTTTEIRLAATPVGLDPIVVRSRRTRMIGDPLNASVITGSAHFLSREDLEARTLAFDNVHDVLRRVPGVHVQEEDGYGLRPNIGMRATGVSRSSNVTLMEDGVLIAPAPYAAPAAYYFPVVGRMEAVEVRKGSSQVRYGPRTIGGALNLVSTTIPERASWFFDTSGGPDRTLKVQARAGDSGAHFGWLVESYQLRSDGFKELPMGGNTGFRVGDYLAKFRVNSAVDAPRYQELELKLGYHDEGSNETYLGLTEADFRQTPMARYAASAKDRMDTEHRQIQLRHFVRLTPAVDLTTTAYRNSFARNWYKLQSVLGTGISTVLDDPDGYADALAVLKGAESGEDALEVRANNREYLSTGIQAVLGIRHEGGRAQHDLEFGIRLHEDEEDRFQWEDGYRMLGGTPVRTSRGVAGTHANRVGSARALSLYLQDEIRIGRVSVVPGVRWERIDFTRTDYPTDTPNRDTPTRVRENRVDAIIPGLGAAYEVDHGVELFGGVHRGFGPPGPGAAEETRAEESVNWEAGLRIRRSGLALQAAAFHSDYRNILGQATLASGEDEPGGLYNGGAVEAYGVETSLDYDLAWGRDLSVGLPVSLSWTASRATFRTDFESDFGPWGTVETGDELPYLPRHQLNASLGADGGVWSAGLSAAASSRTRTRAGQGPMVQPTDRYLVLNLQADYQVGGATLYGAVQNLADREYIVARRPAGVRPGLPRTLVLGVKVGR
jgi:Fe(3+) dicitrate transport protein